MSDKCSCDYAGKSHWDIEPISASYIPGKRCPYCLKRDAEHAEMLVAMKALVMVGIQDSMVVYNAKKLITRVEGVCIRCGKPKRGVHTCLEIVDDKN